MSNIGGARWLRIGLSMGETARTQSRRMLELWARGRAWHRVTHTTVVWVALRVAAIPSVVLVRGPFVGSVVSAAISSVVVVLVARIPSVVVISVARIASVVVVSVARICVARIYVAWICVARICVERIFVARGFCRCSLIDRSFEVEVWTKSRRHSCRRGWRERRARSWCVETARCCKVRGVTSLQELSESLVHFFDAASWIPSRAAVPHYVAHVSIGLFGRQLYLPHTLREVLELALPPFYDNVQVVGRYRVGGVGFSTRGLFSLNITSSSSVSLSACESWNVSTSLIFTLWFNQKYNDCLIFFCE